MLLRSAFIQNPLAIGPVFSNTSEPDRQRKCFTDSAHFPTHDTSSHRTPGKCKLLRMQFLQGHGNVVRRTRRCRTYLSASSEAKRHFCPNGSYHQGSNLLCRHLCHRFAVHVCQTRKSQILPFERRRLSGHERAKLTGENIFGHDETRAFCRARRRD